MLGRGWKEEDDCIPRIGSGRLCVVTGGWRYWKEDDEAVEELLR